MTELPRVDRALATLDAMAEAWVERHGIAQQLQAIPVNCVAAHHQQEARALILRFVKQAYLEGLYNGHVTTRDQIDLHQQALNDMRPAVPERFQE